jgi:hypothetical protein
VPTNANPLDVILGVEPTTPPRKRSPFHHYVKLYYSSRIKEEHERRYLVAKRLYEDATEEEREAQNMEVPKHVGMRTTVSMEFWNLESNDFRAEVAKKAEVEHLEELEAWNARKQAPKTPQQFHQ